MINKQSRARQWYVLKTNPQAEKKVFERLKLAEFDSFLPCYIIIRQWSDRKKKVSVSLIPSVVFIHCESKELVKTYEIPGANGILNFLGKPAVVKDFEIENLKILLTSWDDELVKPILESIEDGVLVEIVRGPFKGLLATSVICKGNHRVIVNIESLGSNFVVNVPRSFLKEIIGKAA